MNQMQVFVSHSSQDTAFVANLVAALRADNMDVWWDEHNVGGGPLLDAIMRQINDRSIFIVVLSKAALSSGFVRQECLMAFNLHMDEPHRLILPVTAGKIDVADLRPNWLFLEQFTRIEEPGGLPYPADEAIRRVLDILNPDDSGDNCVVPPGLSAKDLTDRGFSLYRRFKYACSVRYCQRATELDPKYASAWYNLAYSLVPLGRNEEALAACDRVLELRPRHSFAWNLRGYILSGLGRHAEQVVAAEHALELKPTLARNWANLAEALSSTGRFEDALVACERGLAITPTSEFVREAKANVFVDMQRYEEAIALYDGLLAERHPRQGSKYWEGKGSALHLMGGYQEALVTLHQATTVDSNSSSAWSLLAETLRALGMRREAQDAEHRAKELKAS